MQPNQNSSSSGNADSPASYDVEALPPVTQFDYKGIGAFVAILALLLLGNWLENRHYNAKNAKLLSEQRVLWWQLGFSEGQQFSMKQARGDYTNVTAAVQAAEARFVEIQKEALK